VYWYNQNNDVVLNVFQRTTAYPSQSTLGECADCHAPGSGYTYATTGNPIVSYSGSEHAVYCELVGPPRPPQCSGSDPALVTPVTPASSSNFVVTSDGTSAPPPSSILLLYPAELYKYNSQFHTGGLRCAAASSQSTYIASSTPDTPMVPSAPGTCDLENILEWIEDGANEF
jgi:hypothetical protein